MMMLFGGSEKRKGRGLRIELSMFPNLSPETQKQFLNVFAPEARLPEYFGRVAANFTPNTKDPFGSGHSFVMRGVIHCREAKFELKPSDAERYYTDLFYYIFWALENVVNRFRQAGTITWADIREFGETVSFRPKEDTNSLVPVFPIPEIWSRLYVRDFYNVYGKGNEERTGKKLPDLLRSKQNVLSKDDANLIEQITTFQKDYKTFISKHADEIIALKRKLAGGESWEAGFRRDGGQQIKAGIDAEMTQSPTNEVIWAPMPLSKGDASAVTEFTSKMLSSV